MEKVGEMSRLGLLPGLGDAMIKLRIWSVRGPALRRVVRENGNRRGGREMSILFVSVSTAGFRAVCHLSSSSKD